jgi:hypothetical protein
VPLNGTPNVSLKCHVKEYGANTTREMETHPNAMHGTEMPCIQVMGSFKRIVAWQRIHIVHINYACMRATKKSLFM